MEPARVQWRRFTIFQRHTSPNHMKLPGTTSLHQVTHTRTDNDTTSRVYNTIIQHADTSPHTHGLHQSEQTHTCRHLYCRVGHSSQTQEDGHYTPHIILNIQLPSGTQCPHIAAAELGDGQQVARHLYTQCLA